MATQTQLFETDAHFTITRTFCLGGKAIFTVSNGEGDHYTFKIEAFNFDDESDDAPARFGVYLLTGPDNLHDYTYLGMLDVDTGETYATKASKWKDALAEARRLLRQGKRAEAIEYAKQHLPKPVQVIRWALMKVIWPDRQVPEGYGIHGEGRCGRCTRPLTRPEGVSPDGYRFGFGPTCWAKMQGV
jgi:hypothetical protein